MIAGLVQADLAIVGAGVAGLTAANRAAALGARVVVLEQGADDRYLCNSRIATGVLNVAHTDPHADPALLRRQIEIDTEGHAAPALADALATTAGRAVAWLRAEGAAIVEVPIQGKSRWVLAPPRTLAAGLDWQGRGPDVLLAALAANLKRRGGVLLLATRAERLRMEGGRCIGVSARQGDSVCEVTAESVLLADGGFQGNPQLVRRFISNRPDRLTQRNAGTGRGDALRMAEAEGARITDASAFYGHLLCADSLRNPGLWPYPTMDTLVGGAIMVDRSGARFIDEGLGGIVHANALARLDDPLCATAVFDQAIWDSAGRAELVPPNPRLLAAGGTLISAGDIASLAGAIGVPMENLATTIASYNTAISAGEGDSLTPPRSSGRMFGESRGSSKRVSLLPIARPPYYAIALAVGLTYTMGGIATDAQTRVIGNNGAPLPGLFAAGSCTGGLEGGPLAGYVGGFLKAVTFGLIAGETIGALVKADAP